MLRGWIISIVAVGIYILIKLIIGTIRNPASAVNNKPYRIQSFTTGMPQLAVLRAIARYAQASIYKIEIFDEENSNIVLSDAANLTSYGFFYPIFVRSQGAETLVEVGVKSRSWQVGPMVTRHHDRCFNWVKAAILAGSIKGDSPTRVSLDCWTAHMSA
jgi:hypothetical protein